MNVRSKLSLCVAVLLCGRALVAFAQTTLPNVEAGPVGISIRNEGDTALNRSATWLVAQQEASGAWPGTSPLRQTASCVQAFGGHFSSSHEAVQKAIAFLKAHIGETTSPSPAEASAILLALLPFSETEMETIAALFKIVAADVPAESSSIFETAARHEALRRAEYVLKSGGVLPPGDAIDWEALRSEAPPMILQSGAQVCAAVWNRFMLGFSREDAGIRKARHWLLKNWTLDANPSAAADSVYLYYYYLTRVLHAFGEEILFLPDGYRVEWRKAMIYEVVNRQRIDPRLGGYWQPSAKSSMDEKISTTALAFLTLHMAMLNDPASAVPVE